MKYIRKIGIITFGMMMALYMNFSCGGIRTPGGSDPVFTGDSTPAINDEEIVNINSGSYTFSNKLKGIVRIPQKSEYSTSLGYVTTLIQVAINRLLGILSFVALVYMLYCGFLVFSSGSDDKNASKGKKGISTAAIALAGIGLSWLIISAMLRFINGIAG